MLEGKLFIVLAGYMFGLAALYSLVDAFVRLMCILVAIKQYEPRIEWEPVTVALRTIPKWFVGGGVFTGLLIRAFYSGDTGITAWHRIRVEHRGVVSTFFYLLTQQLRKLL